jgi:hypothetical protein
VNLLLENKGKKTGVQQIVKKAKAIIYFIQQHHVPIEIFLCYETNLML